MVPECWEHSSSETEELSNVEKKSEGKKIQCISLECSE